MKEVEIASQHLQGGWRRLYMSGGVLAVDEQVEVVGEGDHDEHLHLQLEDLGCGTACFGWFLEWRHGDDLRVADCRTFSSTPRPSPPPLPPPPASPYRRSPRTRGRR